MAEILGAATLQNLALPTGWDPTEVAKWGNRQGFSGEQLINDASLAIAGINQQLADKWSFLMSITEEDKFEYPNGGAVTGAKAVTEVSKTDPIHGDVIGHMIELAVYESATSGTMRFLQDARQAAVNSMVSVMTRQVEEIIEWKILNRLFVNTEVQIGSSGYNVGFVTSSGSVVFTPYQYAGQSFASHSHYSGYNSSSSATLATMLDDQAEELAEHGHAPTFTAIVSRADMATYRTLTNFVQLNAPTVQIVDRGGETSGNRYFAQGQVQFADGVFGYYQAPAGLVELRANARITTGYSAMFKSYGNNDPRNPIAVRVRPGKGFGAYLVTVASNRSDYPVEKILCATEMGAGVGTDRTNGCVGLLVAGGTYANPTVAGG